MDREVQNKFLKKALQEVLACPQCKNSLSISIEKQLILCKSCLKKYPIIDGIPIFLNSVGKEQERERIFRDSLKYDSFLTNEKDMLNEVSKHHSISVMRQRAMSFISKFSASEWVADIGTGFSWHWKGNNPKGCYILGIDFSITNLRVAERLLTDQDNVLLICADAANLPMKDKSVSGLWSVQVFQHFPEEIFKGAKHEVGRILKDKFIAEITNLNPSLLLKTISLLLGKKFYPCKDMGDMVLNRFCGEQLKNIWSNFRQAKSVKFTYSELFFHPPYFKWQYSAVIDGIFSYCPSIAKYIARQIHLELIREN